MINLEKVPMRTQSPEIRNKNFEEVELGYNDEEAVEEANRCLNCKIPRCVQGCPINIKIPEFISAIKEKDIGKAYKIISESSSLSAICGRVCPQEKQCEGKCVRGIKGDAIAIGALERYVSDKALINDMQCESIKEKNNKKVAIIGSGPAGLACASELIRNGFSVVIYESLHKAGGVLTYGIPEFRLPKEIVNKQIDNLKKQGVKIKLNIPVGNAITINELKEEYDAIFIGTGAGIPKFMGIEGEDANEVFSANEILTRINLMKSYKDSSKTPIKKSGIAYVIGGGNVAMDAARSLKRLGIETHLMYRRSDEELPARKTEVKHAKEEGIIFDILKNPKRIIKDENNSVIGIEYVDMELGEAGEDGRRKVTEIEGSNKTIKCNMVIMALGTLQNHEALKESNIKLSDKGLIVVNNFETSERDIYAGGDAVTGAATVILAMEAGKKAAEQIMDKCKEI